MEFAPDARSTVRSSVAAIAMGTYMYKLHPALGRNFNRALADEPGTR